MNALHDALDDLASEARPADLAPRVAAGVRRRRQRRTTALAVAAVVGLVGASLGLVARDHDRNGLTTRPTEPAPSGPSYDVVWTVARANRSLLRGLRADGTVVDLGPIPSTPNDLSPDGRRLAFIVPIGIKVMTLGETAARTYDVVDVPPIWSPDGRTIAMLVLSPGAHTSGPYRGLVFLDVATGATTELSYVHAGPYFSWSPDGTMLAVTTIGDPGRPGGIDVITRSGMLVRHLDTPSRVWGDHAWSPDGTRIVAFTSGFENPVVLSATTGAVVARLPRYAVYAWRDADHLADVTQGVYEELTLDGTVTRRVVLRDADPSAGEAVAVRPAS